MCRSVQRIGNKNKGLQLSISHHSTCPHFQNLLNLAVLNGEGGGIEKGPGVSVSVSTLGQKF